MRHLCIGLLAVALLPAVAEAGRRHSSFDISIGVGSHSYYSPHHYRDVSFRYSRHHHYHPRPVYVAPRPVYVHPRPVYVAPPVYVSPPPVYVAPPPRYYHCEPAPPVYYERTTYYYHGGGGYYYGR